MGIPTVASYNSVTPTSTASTTVTITKPTGLAVGDVLYAIVGQGIVGSAPVWTVPGGWTEIGKESNTGGGYMTIFKVAEASDVAASNFTFTSNTNTEIGGILLRITGVSVTTPLVDSEFDKEVSITSGNTYTFAGDSTPTGINSLIIASHFIWHNNSGAVAFSSYTSTPALTWTEGGSVGYRDGGSNDILAMAVAYANTTSLSTITAYGATRSDGVAGQGGLYGTLAIFNGKADGAANSTVLISAPTIATATAANSSRADINAVDASPTIITQNGRKTATKTAWSNATKPSTSWTNDTL